MFSFKKSQERIYLDYASTTPVDSQVLKAMQPYFTEKFYNASALYKEGVESRRVIENARKRIAKHINCHAEEIIFTGSGTESNNLALLGLFRRAKQTIEKPHVIVSNIEHPAVLEVARAIEKEGGEVTYLNVNKDGLVNVVELKEALKPETILVSLIYVNNEIGVIQPIKEIGRMIRLWKRDNGRNTEMYPYYHIDASQVPAYLSVDKNPLGVDLMTLDGSKIYGPKGIGVLFKKLTIEVEPLMYGGGQENGIRPGTENVSLIVGCAEALDIVAARREKESARLKELQDYFIDMLEKEIPFATLNGSRTERIPNNINICIKDMNAEFTVLQLDSRGICCSFMTSCKNLNEESSSYVVAALKELNSSECARSSLRFTMGIGTTKKDIDTVIYELKTLLPLSKLA